MILHLSERAEEDIAEAIEFYERQESGLGRYFRSSVLADLEKLSYSAGVHRKIHSYHRLLIQPFPYAAFYKVEQGVVHIEAILDCRRDPKWINDRLE